MISPWQFRQFRQFTITVKIAGIVHFLMGYNFWNFKEWLKLPKFSTPQMCNILEILSFVIHLLYM